MIQGMGEMMSLLETIRSIQEVNTTAQKPIQLEQLDALTKLNGANTALSDTDLLPSVGQTLPSS